MANDKEKPHFKLPLRSPLEGGNRGPLTGYQIAALATPQPEEWTPEFKEQMKRLRESLQAAGEIHPYLK